MSRKEITVCDGCGREIKQKSQCYHLDLKTDRFWNVVEMDYNLIRLDFCEACAHRIKQVLEKKESDIKLRLVDLICQARTQVHLLRTGELADFDDIKPSLMLLSSNELVDELEKVLAECCEIVKAGETINSQNKYNR